MAIEVTLFHTDRIERQTLEPIAEEARRRGHRIRHSERLDAAAAIGVYCSHRPSPINSRLSAILLHDLAQRHDVWPDYWLAEPWNEFDIGFLPGPSWVDRWTASSWQPESRPRIGVYEAGWPKADALFGRAGDFQLRAEDLRRTQGLRRPFSVLYAPSWENHGKQNDFVVALRELPVNLLLKQAPWSDHYPEVLANIAAMNALHRDAGPDVHILSPDIGILECLALSDVMVSDESSVLVEALLLGVPGIAVTDWLIPDCAPPRPAIVPFDFVTKVRCAELRSSVESALADPGASRARLEGLRDRHFACLGQSAARILDVLEAHAEGRECPHRALTPLPGPPLAVRLRQLRRLATDLATMPRRILSRIRRRGDRDSRG